MQNMMGSLPMSLHSLSAADKTLFRICLAVKITLVQKITCQPFLEAGGFTKV